jgi:fructokinase
MASVLCLGELLIDFCSQQADVPLCQAEGFSRAPGGAPANVAAGAVRLGVSADFVGAVGDDPFGEYLRDVLDGWGVGTSGLATVPGVRTTLAFIASRSDGRKDIAFYRNPGADMYLSPDRLDETQIRAAEAVHFGSISRIDDAPRAATDRARELAGETGAILSYDPNYRPALWGDAAHARRRILEGFEGATVAKVSEEEWAFITGCEDFPAGAAELLDRGTEIVVRSEGPAGASWATRSSRGHVNGFAVEAVDTLGAGDAFCASLICGLMAHRRQGRNVGDLASEDLDALCRRANAVGALACTKRGAIPALPSRTEVQRFLAEGR